MGRRTIYSGTPIGREMEEAIRRINRLQQTAAAVLTEYTSSVEQTIAMLFDDEDVAKATAAKDIVVAPYNSHVEYTLGNVIGQALHLSLGIDFEGSRCPALRPRGLAVNPSRCRCAPLVHYIKHAEAVYLQYEGVKAVLRWLNDHATLNAIRYYFPTVLLLCPETFQGMELASRHHTPERIHDWLQPMRDAAATVASAAMLPTSAEARKRKRMWLTFASRSIQLSPDSKYHTDIITFYI